MVPPLVSLLLMIICTTLLDTFVSRVHTAAQLVWNCVLCLLGLEKKRMVTLGAAWISSDLVASSDIKFESSHTAKIKENLPLLVVVLEEFQGVFT